MRQVREAEQKIHIGRVKNVELEQKTAETGHFGSLLTAVGIMGIAVMLVLPMLPSASENVNPIRAEEAVAVMSTAVSESGEKREELVLPDKKTYAAEDESIFEDIGEFFASLIFGEG